MVGSTNPIASAVAVERGRLMTVLLRKLFTGSSPCRFEARATYPLFAVSAHTRLAPHFIGRVLELSHGAQPPPGA
jgi:hypothetical protein